MAAAQAGDILFVQFLQSTNTVISPTITDNTGGTYSSHGGDATDVSIVVAVSGGQSCALFTESQVVSTAGPYTLGVSVDPSSRFFGQAVGFYGITVSNSALDVDVVAFPPVS